MLGGGGEIRSAADTYHSSPRDTIHERQHLRVGTLVRLLSYLPSHDKYKEVGAFICW